MSTARDEFLRSLSGIAEAINLESLAQGATGTAIPPAIYVLRRGILVASLVALETFIRDRTAEALTTLERWPRDYEDLPEKLRIAARLNSLSNLQQFAKMLKRQGDDFESELKDEIAKMASGHGTVLQFTKFVAGDFTGNISDTGLKELLSSLQVNDCWNSYRQFSSDIGIGVPSVQEVVKGIVRKRHRSAHSSGYAPTPTDIVSLSLDMLCVAVCFDVSVSASMQQAIAFSTDWANGEKNWRDGVKLFLVEPHARGFRLLRHGQQRALKISHQMNDIKASTPRAGAGEIAVLIERDATLVPVSWTIL